MKVKIQHRLYGGFISAILLVIVVAIISISTFRKEYHEADLVKHSYQVLNSLKSFTKIAHRHGNRSPRFQEHQ